MESGPSIVRQASLASSLVPPGHLSLRCYALTSPGTQALLLRASGHSYKELAETLQLERASVGTLLIRAEAEFEKRYRKLYGREEVL